jgi:hypothetical protein
MRLTKFVPVIAILAVFAVTGAGCASDNDSSGTSTTASSGTTASAVAEKTGEKKDTAAETRAALLKRLKKEPDMKGVPDAFADCMVDVIIKYAKPDEIKKYLSGKIELDTLDSLNSDGANDAGFKCTKLVTAPPN